MVNTNGIVQQHISGDFHIGNFKAVGETTTESMENGLQNSEGKVKEKLVSKPTTSSLCFDAGRRFIQFRRDYELHPRRMSMTDLLIGL